jgi:cytochrome c2
MRKELELLETIEKYLQNSLTEAEKLAFEKRLQSDPALQKEIVLQRELIQGINRVAIKQSVQKGLKKYKFNRNLKNWGLTGLTLAVFGLSSVFLYNKVNRNGNENAPQELPELNEQGEKLWSDADRYLPLQSFRLNPEKDTVIETKGGIVFAIPAHSFLDAKGNPAKGSIELEVKEALKAIDIMKGGLNTKSGGRLLETGGMFYINARQDGASLKIDPQNALYAEIPTDEVKPDMQLFEGKRLADGSIDWVNPKPIQKDLIPVDILSLNFYPPNYLDSLKGWGHDISNKKFTDSLYFSFAARMNSEEMAMMEKARQDSISAVEAAGAVEQAASGNYSVNFKSSYVLDKGQSLFIQNCAACHSIGSDKITGPGLAGVTKRVPSEEWLKKFIKNSEAMIKSGDPYAIKISKYDASSMTVFSHMSDKELHQIIEYLKQNDSFEASYTSGINPAKIKTIWSEKFQNTLLATREFEERLPFIHRTCNEDVLDLYVNNLDKNLSAIDSMVAESRGEHNAESDVNYFPGYPEFKQFAARGDGKVKNGNKNVGLLKAYYQQKSKIYTEAISKTINEFWAKQSESNMIAQNKRHEKAEKDEQQIFDNFQKELDLNLTEAYRQLGKERPVPPPSAGTYGVSVANTGWNNVDKYVMESTLSRTTLNYTDPETGKKAVIKYEPIEVTVENVKEYDRVLVYLLPDELNSFMRMEKNNNEIFEEQLNELVIYKLVCLGYKGEDSFYFSQDNVKPGNISVSLKKSSNTEISDNINRLNNRDHSKAMNDELSFMAFEKEEAKRQQMIISINELTNMIRPVIFPCSEGLKDTVMISENDSINVK